jgi:glycosyltransferase involved in cell wall biosynthesis
MARKPRVIAVDLTPVLPGGENGGAKVFVLELLRHLPVLAPQCRFILFTQRDSHDELAVLDCDNVQRVLVLDHAADTVGRSALRTVAARWLPYIPTRLRRLLADIGYRLNRQRKRSSGLDLLHRLGVDLLYCPFTAPLYAEPGVPVVTTIHDLQYRTFPQFFAADDVAHRDAVFRAACRKSTRIAAVSDYTRESAIRHGSLDPRRISTIHTRLACRLAFPGSAPTEVLARLGLVKGRYLIYPANFWRHKNHEMLLTAFGMAAARDLEADIRLVCTGAPGLRCDYLVRAAGALGLAERVLFPGFVDAEDLAALLANSAGMVFPSLYEGFGLPLLEAMAAEVPVACSDTTSLPEVAGGAALLFNPRSVETLARAIGELVGNPSLRATLLAAGATRAQEFVDAGRMAREYWALFCEAVNEAPEHGAMSGVSADGWAGALIRVDIARRGEGALLEIELEAPGWIPAGRVDITVDGSACDGVDTRNVRRGHTLSWSMPVHPGQLRLHLWPTFVPQDCGQGNDLRELSLLVRRLRLRHADGGLEDLLEQDWS